jgi:hypothetical protein
MGSTSFTSKSRTSPLADSLRNNLAVAARQADGLNRIATELGATAKEMQLPSLRELFDSIGLKGLPTPSLARARGCRLPECDCPSSDLGTIRRRVDRPDVVTATVRLRNSGTSERGYRLEAAPMQSTAGEAGGIVRIEPPELKLGPGESAVVRLMADASKHAQGVDYETSVRIRSKGCDDLVLGLTVVVELEKEVVPTIDLHCCCTPPGRRLRWYHHSYCQPSRVLGQADLPKAEGVGRPDAIVAGRPDAVVAGKPKRPANPVN